MNAPIEKSQVTIDIVSDVMCPWCYIGKKRLENALAEVPDNIDVKVQWMPYQLDATLPKLGKDRKQYFIDKFGSLDAYAQVYAPIRDAGVAEGIAFKLDDIKVSPNTMDAHRLIHWAGQDYGLEVQHELVSILMRFYFEEGKNIGDNEVLLAAAKLADMGVDYIKERLESDEDKEVISGQINSMQAAGVSGVPFFIVNKKYALQGAQPKEHIIQVIQDVASKN
ncbi:MAG: DsbA family oxidoreductase [Lentilitoribacter sp.]